jgi:hypothetical protein
VSSQIVLVHPPFAKPCEPSPGILALAAHLRGLGREVQLTDGNLETWRGVLDPERLRRDVERLVVRGGADESSVTSGRRAARRIAGAVASLRTAEGYVDRAHYRSALGTLAEALRLVSRVSGATLSVSDLQCGLSPLSSGDLLSVARSPELLPLHEELRALAERILTGPRPRLVGVSVTYLSQALPAFALAGLLRRLRFDGLLVMGGGLPTSWAGMLSPASSLFGVWDAIVVGPGEAALAALSGERSEGPAPGLLFPAAGSWAREADRRSPLSFEPAVEGLPWSEYLAPSPILPVASSRGCYWRRCAFCPEAASSGRSFRQVRASELARILLRARDQYGFSRVHLTDDAIPPAVLRGLARELRDEGISWYGFSRLERSLLDPSFAADLARSGCAMLQLGVESASQRLLDLLGKGTRVEDAGSVLANLTEAGIRTYVYLLFGSPSETREEAERTVEWSVEHRGSISFLNLALMNLPARSAPALEPGRFGVSSLTPFEGDNDLALYVGFTVPASPDRREVRRVLGRARSHALLRPILQRVPAGFTSNHAAFAPLT